MRVSAAACNRAHVGTTAAQRRIIEQVVILSSPKNIAVPPE